MNDTARTPDTLCLQERFAPDNACFGCGPANPQGLHIRSFPSSQDERVLVAEWTPQKHHEAFPGLLNGGIVGALLDCHSNWTALWNLMLRDGMHQTPCTVTADFHVKMRRPTPTDGPLQIRAWPAKIAGKRVVVESELRGGESVTATCTGTFVAVGPDHPAFYRW